LLVAKYARHLLVFAGTYLIHNLIINSHNVKMLCCELPINFQNAQPLCLNTKPAIEDFLATVCQNCVSEWNQKIMKSENKLGYFVL